MLPNEQPSHWAPRQVVPQPPMHSPTARGRDLAPQAQGSSAREVQSPETPPGPPGQEAPAEDAPAQDASAQEPPGQDAAGQEAPGQEAPAQQAPAQDAPGQDTPAQEPTPPAGDEAAVAEFSFTWDGIKEWASDLVAELGMLVLWTLLILAVAWLALKVAKSFAHWLQKKFVKRTSNELDDHIFVFLLRAVRMTIVVAALLEICRIWSVEEPEKWIEASWMLLLFLLGSRLVGALLRLTEAPLLARNPNLVTAMPLINRGARIGVVVLGALFALAHAGLNIAPLLGGAGVMGLALSLAAKDTLSNLIAGVLLTIDRPFQVGDRIELWNAPRETGTWGDVVDIGLRATKIRNPDNLVVVVPNNEIMQRDIINYTMSGDDIRLRLPFSVAYESDVHRAKDVLVRVALKVKNVRAEPAPFVIVRGFGPSEVNLQLRVWISDARARRRVGDEITERALEAFEAEGLEIPYPKRELYIRQGPALPPPPSPSSLPPPSPPPQE